MADENIVTLVTFQTGSAKYKALEEKVFVASGRFIIAAGQPIIAEYLISEVANGPA